MNISVYPRDFSLDFSIFGKTAERLFETMHSLVANSGLLFRIYMEHLVPHIRNLSSQLLAVKEASDLGNEEIMSGAIRSSNYDDRTSLPVCVRTSLPRRRQDDEA
jgi:hypothetical protein